MLRNVIRKQVDLLKSLTAYFPNANYSSTSKRNPYGPIHEINEQLEYFDEANFPQENPLTRSFRILHRDWVLARDEARATLGKHVPPTDEDDYGPLSKNLFPVEADVLIIGGGAMGSSIAYWLKQRIPGEFSVVVVEKDATYKNASTALSVGGLRQQFTFEENIEMSLFSAEFLRNADRYLDVEGEPRVDVQFRPYGYLFMATDKSAQILQDNSKLQNSLGARNVLLTPTMLKDKFPWLNTDGIALGCLGVEKEGWFDPWSLLMGFKRKAISLGARYITAEAKGFIQCDASPYIDVETGKCLHQRLDKLVVQLPNGQKKAIKFGLVVVACGAFSAKIARMAGIGTGPGPFSVPLPVEPRKRYVYCFHCPEGPGLNTPLTIDPSGAYFRREGLSGLYVCGQSPELDEEPPIHNLNVDEDYFYNTVWPNLAKRVPTFEKMKLKGSWAGFYEHNYFDQNGIIGNHPIHGNMVFATGFSGHGIQQSPAVGRAIMELVVHSRFMTIDLNRMGFNRFFTLEPMEEIAIV